jgi:predicted nucleic acid-binding Zn ribbon protein
MSKHKKEEKFTLPNHRHCLICGKPINAHEQFCGEECKEEFKKFSKRRKMQFVTLFAMYGLMFLALFILPRLIG